MRVTDDIKYVGVNDHDVDLLEGQYVVPLGMAYIPMSSWMRRSRSWILLDKSLWPGMALTNLAAVLDWSRARLSDRPAYGRARSFRQYHQLLKVYPDAVVVGNAKTFTFMEQFYGKDPSMKKQIVKNGEQLVLGSHTLTFPYLRPWCTGRKS